MKTRFLRAASTAGAIAILAAPLAAQTTFHEYVALGDSLTAGVQGACLVGRNQKVAYPALVAKSIGIADFELPLVGEITPPQSAAGVCLGLPTNATAFAPGAVSQQGAPLNPNLARPYDDLGIPSARVQDLVDLTTSNPTGGGVQSSAALVLRNFPGSPFNGMSAVDEANLLSPDLVSLWIGNNDVLGAATSGVAIDGVTVTPAAAFAAKYTQVVNAIKGSGRTLVFMNIPDVTAIPFTTTIAPFVIVGGNKVPFLGPRTTATCATAPCPLPDGTLLTLQAQALLSTGHGVPVAAGGRGDALPDGGFDPATGTLTPGVILYPDEVTLLQQRTDDFNATIAAQAASSGAILIDIHTIFNGIKAHGYTIAGIHLTSGLLVGGLFSADGVHPSSVAQAIVADYIIKALNAAKSTDFPEPDIATALFTRNVPANTSAATLSMNQFWRALFGGASPFEDLAVTLPIEDRETPVAPTRPQRGTRRTEARAAAVEPEP